MRYWRKVFRGAADKHSAFDPIGRRFCHGKDVRDRVHGTGISAAYVLGPLGFQQHQMPSTRPDKINLTILLIAIKEQRGPGMIELLIFAQFSEDKGFPDGSYKRTKY
jgi:hypothetical protein